MGIGIRIGIGNGKGKISLAERWSWQEVFSLRLLYSFLDWLDFFYRSLQFYIHFIEIEQQDIFYYYLGPRFFRVFRQMNTYTRALGTMAGHCTS